MAVRTITWMCALCLSLTACGAGRTPQQALLLSGADPVPTMRVRNDNWLDVVIYLVRGAARFRIGTVGGNSTETFRLGAAKDLGSSPMRIMADPIGSTSRYLSDPILVGPDQFVELKVGSPLSLSTFAVWNR